MVRLSGCRIPCSSALSFYHRHGRGGSISPRPCRYACSLRPPGYADLVPAGCLFERLAESPGGCRVVAAGSSEAWHSVRLSSRILDLSGRRRRRCTCSIRTRRGRFVGCARSRILAYLAQLVPGRCVSQHRAHPAIALPGNGLAEAQRCPPTASPGGSCRVFGAGCCRTAGVPARLKQPENARPLRLHTGGLSALGRDSFRPRRRVRRADHHELTVRGGHEREPTERRPSPLRWTMYSLCNCS